MLLDAVCGIGIRSSVTGEGEEGGVEEVVDEDDDSNHEALLFKAEPAAAHVILLDDLVTSADLVEAAGDHAFLLQFGSDIGDGDERNSCS